MKTVVVLIALLFLSSPAYAWTKADSQRQLVYTAIHIVDWGQTRNYATRDGYYETNPILGKNPSIQEVDTYFAATLAGHTLVSYYLPPKYRAYWQMFWIGAEFRQVTINYSIGISVHF